MRIPKSSRANRRNKEGIAVIVVLALLGLVLAFIFANLRTLSDLRGELKIVEQKQIRRLNHSSTNAPPETHVIAPTNSLTQARSLLRNKANGAD